MALAVLLIDQLSKWVVVHALNLKEVQAIDVIDPWLNLRMAWNQGVNFGLFSSDVEVMRWVLVAVALASLVAVPAGVLAAWKQDSALDLGLVATATLLGIPVPAFASSLSYYDGLRAERLPAALTQGLRDYFGAHTYKRIDKEGTFHTLWSGDRTEIEAVDTH